MSFFLFILNKKSPAIVNKCRTSKITFPYYNNPICYIIALRKYHAIPLPFAYNADLMH